MSDPRHERWNNAALALGAFCLLVIAVFEAVGFATAMMRNVLLGGLFVAGTVMWAVQSRQICPHCGNRCGFSPRITKPYQCRTCGRDIRDRPGGAG